MRAAMSRFNLESSFAIKVEGRSGRALLGVSNMVRMFQHATGSRLIRLQVGVNLFFTDVRSHEERPVDRS